MEQRDSEGLVSKENEAGMRKGRGAPSEPICAGSDVQASVCWRRCVSLMVLFKLVCCLVDDTCLSTYLGWTSA